MLLALSGIWAAAAWSLWQSAVPGDLRLPDVQLTGIPPSTLARADRYERFFRIEFVDSQLVLLGVLAAYAKYGINIEGVLQLPKFRKDRLPFVTTLEECSESVLDRALAEVAKSDFHVQPPLALPIFS